MIKIKVRGEGFADFEYFSTIPPIIGDTIDCPNGYRFVKERVIHPTNQNFIIIKVK